jgi:hypothetical protein
MGIQDVGLRSDINKDKLGDLYFWLGNFPVLLLEWDNVVEWSINYIDKKMLTRWNKTFICSAQDNSTIYMWVIGWINIPEMPAYLKKNFNCRNAINLDAGNSIGMIYSWFVLDQWPRKRIMDAFVVLTRDEYIKLTWITPPVKWAYCANITYQLNDKDRETVKTIYNVLQKFIIQNWEKQKRSFISILRSALSSPSIMYDYQKTALIKELLFKMYIIDTM